MALALLVWILPLAAQTVIKPRGERLPAPPRLRTLSIRESTLSSIVTNASATYRKEAGSQGFLLESSEGEPVVEWKIGGEIHPLPESAPAPARVVEKRVKVIPHENKFFLKIETLAKGAPGRAEEEVRFSGTYEATTMEGEWAAYQKGGKLKVRIAAADHERYLKEMQKAYFGEAMLAKHVASFRLQLTALLEQKLTDPGATPAQELEMVRALVTLVNAHPETFVVTVTPSYESEPEIFTLEGDAMRSTTGKQTTTLRFNARLPALAPGGP
jgi:hypothetical protein